MAKNNNELKLAISLSSEIDQFLYGTSKKAKKEFSQMTKAATQTAVAIEMEFKEKEEKVESLFSKLGKAGDKAFKATAKAAMDAGKTIGKFSTMAAKEGIAFESAFDGVMKTTQASSAEYESMRNEILSMTREIPSASSEIAAIASAAGQLGIPKDDIMEFSKTMLELGSTTNLSAASAAEQLTKLGRITGMSTDEYDRLGSVLVSLGNEFNTAESQITDMAVKLASSGNFAEYSEAQIMAVATSMAGLGIEAGAGGTAMGELTDKIKKAVESGSKDLQTYAATANMTAEEFKESFAGDQAGTVADFLSGFGNMEMDDQSSSAFLDGMGFSDKSIINTISNIASSGDLMSRALETSNLAWNDNIALTQEASERFDTTQGKLTIMKNSFQEIGIQLYDQFNQPLRDIIFAITEFAQALATKIGNSSFFQNLADNISNAAPTFIRKVTEMGESLYRFIEPFFKVGAWIASNTGLIEGAIVGIGSALAAYKVANGIMSVSKALTSLSSAGAAGGVMASVKSIAALAASCWPLLAVAGAAVAIVGIGTAIYKASEKAKEARIEERFGKISLSLEEVKKTANSIVMGGTLGQLDEVITAFGEVQNIRNGITETTRALNMANWKVEVGIELTEDEMGAYKNNIDQYIQQAHSYVQAQQYSVNISLGLLTDVNMENSNLLMQINQFYSSKETELNNLGKKLNDAITEAFSDDLLTFDEVKVITELQQQMARVQESIAEGSFEADLALLNGKYSSELLTKDSIMNLQAENNKLIDEGIVKYDDVYKNLYIANKAMLDDEVITYDQFELNDKYYQASRLNKITEMKTKSSQFYGENIGGRYQEELGRIPDLLGEALEKFNFDGKDNAVLNFEVSEINKDIRKYIGKDTQRELSDLWEPMKESYDSLLEQRKQYENLGVLAPKELEDTISEMSLIGAGAGDENAILEYMAFSAKDNEENRNKVNLLASNDVYVPEQIKEASMESVGLDYKSLENEVEVLATEGIKLNALKFIIDTGNISYKKYVTDRVIGVGIDVLRANGGVITKPEIAMIAEAGYPEVIVPINGSQNAISLWQKAGEMLGIGEQKKGLSFYGNQLINSAGSGANSSEEANKFTFSPVYQFNGEAPDRKTLDDHVKSSFDQWEGMMNRWMKNNQRFSFS